MRKQSEDAVNKRRVLGCVDGEQVNEGMFEQISLSFIHWIEREEADESEAKVIQVIVTRGRGIRSANG